MVKKLCMTAGVVLALSGGAWAQMSNPGSAVVPGAAGPIGAGPDASPGIPGTSPNAASDPRRAPSGTRSLDNGPLGTTGGVDAGSATNTIPGSSITGGANARGNSSIGTGSGATGSGAVTGGAGAAMPGAGGMSGSGTMGGAAGTGAGMGGAGAAGAGGAGR